MGKLKDTSAMNWALAFVVAWFGLWLAPTICIRLIPDRNYHAPTESLAEKERAKQLSGCIANGGKPEAWSDGTFKKCN